MKTNGMYRFGFLFVICLLGFTGMASCSESGRAGLVEEFQGIPRYDPEALKARMESGEEVFLLDVREPHELEEVGAIEGCVNIPMGQLEARLAEVPRDRPVLVY